MSSVPSTRTFRDEKGAQVRLTPLLAQDRESLVEMYCSYPAEHRSLDLPPRGREAIEEWLSTLLDEGRNFVAKIEGDVVGHAAYTPLVYEEADFVGYVHPTYHDRGIGTSLVQHAIQHAASEGFDSIASSVQRNNRRAIHVYKKIGFEELDGSDVIVKMGRDLDDCRPDDIEVADGDAGF